MCPKLVDPLRMAGHLAVNRSIWVFVDWQMVIMVKIAMMKYMEMPTAESRSHWTIAMQVRRSPFKISENLSRLFTHLTKRSVRRMTFY